MLANIPVIQSLRILEGAASIAILFSPERLKKCLQELGVSEEVAGGEAILDVRELAQLQKKVKGLNL